MKFVQNLRGLNRTLSVLIAVLFLVTIISTVYLAHTLADSRTLIKDGRDAISSVLVLQDLEINLQTAESAQRGYIITGDPAYLESYTAAVKLIPAEQRALSNKNYNINSKQLTELNNLINKRLAGIKYSIDLRETQGYDAAAASVKTNKGLVLTTNIQESIKTIAQQKIGPFGPTYERTQNNLHYALYVAATMVSFVFIISLLILLYFQRAINKERATEGIKNEFLSLASHQLRTPASNVKQYLGLLLEGYLGKLTPEQKDALQVANKNNDIGINIINDLLDVAKLDLEKIHINKEQANIYNLVKEVLDDYRPYLKERRQVAKFDRASKRAEALVDVNYLKSVFENLVDNASKYSPKKAHIHIKVEQHSKKVIVSIKDEGVGIKRIEKTKLFKKFSRIPSELTGNVEGSGLGLYWVKQIVELHGGKVVVKSRYGRGSTFIVELPTA